MTAGLMILLPDGLAAQTIPPEEEVSRIFTAGVSRGTRREVAQGLKNLLQLMAENGTPFYWLTEKGPGLIGQEDVVLLKINAQWDQRGGTNTDLVLALAEAIFAHPAGFTGEVIIADNGQAQYGAKGRGGSLDWKVNNAEDRSFSNQDVITQLAAEGKRISGTLWDTITTTQAEEYRGQGAFQEGFVLAAEKDEETDLILSYPQFTTGYGTRINFRLGVWEPRLRRYLPHRLKVINLPVLKHHSIYGLTGAVKNYMGTTSDKLTRHNAHNTIGIGSMGTQMAETRVPVLTIMDALWINPVRGPWTPDRSAVYRGLLAASADPVALDAWAAREVLIPAAEKAGNRNTAAMDPDNTRPGSFGSWLRLSREELNRAGHPFTMKEEEIQVFSAE